MCTILDNIQEKFNNCFNEVNMRLFHYMTFIDLSNFFAAFNTNILLKFTKFYPIIFFPHDI